MELTKLLFNNLSVSGNNLKLSSDVSSKNESKFEDYMNKNNVFSEKNVKDVSKKNEKPIKVDKKNKNYSDKNIKANESDSSKKIDAEKTEKQKDQTVDTEIDKGKEVKSSSESKDLISEKETELKEEIAEILGVDAEDVENILKQLGITVFDLKDSQNLLDFMQLIFEALDPSDLLTVEGIKNIISDIKQIVKDQTAEFENIFKDVDFEAFNKFEDIKQEDKIEEKSVISKESKENSNINSETAEKPVENFSKQVALKNENISLREKSNNVSEEVKTEQIQTESSQIKTSEDMNMQNSFSQQSFQENKNGSNNMNFNNNENIDKSNGMTVTTFDNINKALSQVAAKNQIMRNVNTADVINQIIEKFKVSIVKENISEIKITLKPDYLGDVALKIVSENGIVSAQFTAENQKVKEIIEANFNNLKNMLDDQGVQVSALSVSVGSENSEERQKFEFEQTKSSKRINSIINSASEEIEDEEEIVEYIDEGDVLQTSVNYTA